MVFGIVPVRYRLVVIRAMFENSKLLVEIAREEGEERDYGEDYVGDEGVGAGGEGGGDAVGNVSIYSYECEEKRVVVYIKPTATSRTLSRSAKLEKLSQAE